MTIRLFFIALLLSSPLAYAKEISSPPPVDLLLLPYSKVFEVDPVEGAHGLKEHCYKVNEIFVVYSENLLGEGYSFSKENPNKDCGVSNSTISQSNKLGLAIGISKEEASKLLGIELSEGTNRIRWIYQRPIHNRTYDDMTTLDITITSGLVYAITLFNTVTS